MKINQFIAMSLLFYSDAAKLLRSKNDDYSKGEAFGAFDKQAQIAKVLDLDVKKREHDALYRIVGKLVRLRALEDKDPQHESVRDNCMDGINFFTLYYGMRIEKKKEEK